MKKLMSFAGKNLKSSRPSKSSLTGSGFSVIVKTTIILFFVFALTVCMNINTVSAQFSRKQIKEVEKYYSGPYKNGKFVICVVNGKVDENELTNEEYGTILVGGLLFSFDKARNNEDVGVVVVNPENKITALTIKKSVLKDFLKGKISQRMMLDELYSFNISADEFDDYRKHVAL